MVIVWVIGLVFGILEPMQSIVCGRTVVDTLTFFGQTTGARVTVSVETRGKRKYVTRVIGLASFGNSFPN